MCRHCGCHLVGTAQGGGKYIYYHCSSGKMFSDPGYYLRNFGTKKCPQKNWKEAEITAGLLKSMSLIEPNDVVFQNLRKQIGQEIVGRHEAAGNELTFLRKRRTELQGQLDRLLLRMTENQDREDLQDFKQLRDKLKPGLVEVEGQIRELEDLDDSFVETGLETLKTAQEFVNIFKIKDLSSGTLETDKELPSKKLLLKAVILTILCGESIPKLGEKYAPFAVTFDGVEPFYNEPFNGLWEIKMSRELIKREEAFGPQPSWLPMSYYEKERGRRDSNSRPPA